MMYDASAISLTAVLSDMGVQACYRAVSLDDGRWLDIGHTGRAYATADEWLHACAVHYIYAATAADALDGREVQHDGRR